MYSLSSVDTEALGNRAWRINSELNNPIIYQDKDTELVKVFTFEKEIGPWHLVKSAPPKELNSAKPENWHVGFCGELADSYTCKASVTYKDIYYEYSIQEHNILLHEKIKSALLQEIQDWEAACPAD